MCSVGTGDYGFTSVSAALSTRYKSRVWFVMEKQIGRHLNEDLSETVGDRVRIVENTVKSVISSSSTSSFVLKQPEPHKG